MMDTFSPSEKADDYDIVRPIGSDPPLSFFIVMSEKRFSIVSCAKKKSKSSLILSLD